MNLTWRNAAIGVTLAIGPGIAVAAWYHLALETAVLVFSLAGWVWVLNREAGRRA